MKERQWGIAFPSLRVVQQLFGAKQADFELSDEDRAIIDARQQQVTVAFCRGTAWVLVATIVLLMPVSLWWYWDDWEAFETFLIWGPGCVCLALAGLALSRFAPRSTVAIYVIAFCLCGVVIGLSISDLGGFDAPFFYGMLAAPIATVALVINFVPRVITTFLISAFFLLGFLLPHPEYLQWQYGAQPILVMGGLSLLSVVWGEAFARVVYSDLAHQRAFEVSTERRLQAEQRYRELIESIDDVVHAVDAEGCATYVSPAIEKVLGYLPEEVVGRCVTELVHPGDAGALTEWHRHVRSSDNPHCSLQFRMVARDGSTRWVQTRERLVESNGVFEGMRGTLVDVTARHLAEEEARLAHDKADRLLLNVLPETIAARLKESESPIADGFRDVTLLFADVVQFTPLSGRLGPRGIVELLNELFLRFDDIIERHGAEKIRTVGDGYMVACGAPTERDDHAEIVANVALEMLDVVVPIPGAEGAPVQFRIGMNTGPAVGGVIGRSRFHYDIWGETVNLASRLEALSSPGRILVSDATYERVRDRFVFEERGTLDVKGHGPLHAWWLCERV